MAEAEKDLENEESTTPEERDKVAKDPSLIAVIDKNAKIVATGEKCRVKDIEKISIGNETIVRAKTEVILLDEAPAARDTRGIVKNGYNPRVIELSDKISKMELRREFEVDVARPEHSAGESGDSRSNVAGGDDGSAEILSRLPPGTILIKQSSGSNAATRSCSREDSDYVHDSSKDSTETNSSESSGAASYTAAGKVKRMQHRTGRSKKIVEVRRNPVRNKKKKPVDEDFPRPRQRLLSVKRKASFVVDTAARKRVKATPMPYMNTRSVTRKMYTVGATYQAPTIHDAIEWKEWPAHGMHERPIWHPQVGLAFEYIDRNFVSLDGQTYREIIDEPVIEVVSVDPHPERMLLSRGKRKLEGIRSNNFLGTMDTGDADALEQGRSFEACMHGSFHSVLAYCSRVVTPAYKKNVDMKFRRASEGGDVSDNGTAVPKLSSDVAAASAEENKIGIQSVIPAASSRTIIPETANLPSTSSSSEVSKCLVVPRRMISFTNVRNMQGNVLQEVFSRSSKNTLIFLKPTDPPTKPEKMCTKILSAKLSHTIVKDSVETVTTEMNLTKLDDNAISDEALMEMSSIYKKLLPGEKIETTSTNPSKAAVDVRRPTTARVTAKVSKISSSEEVRDNRTGSTNIVAACPPRFSCSNQAADIAKILAEYNEKAAKKSGSRRACYSSSSGKAAGMKTAKLEKECSNSKNNRTTYLSLVEQPKNVKLKRDDDDNSNKSSTHRGTCILPKQESTKSSADVASKSVPITTPPEAEDAGKDTDDNSRAIDLTTAKPSVPREDQSTKSDPDESMNQQWLQELIEDTALLYCAAAGVHQDDVADYLNTLDSSQSIQWLGS